MAREITFSWMYINRPLHTKGVGVSYLLLPPSQLTIDSGIFNPLFTPLYFYSPFLELRIPFIFLSELIFQSLNRSLGPCVLSYVTGYAWLLVCKLC